MRVFIDDGMQIRVGTGIGKYSQYLYDALSESGLCQVDLSSYSPESNSKKGARAAYIKYINSSEYFRLCGQYDVVHFTNYLMPFRKNPHTKYVVTIHDLASFLYPQSLPRFYGIYNRFATRYAVRHADAILTVSESARKEIASMWPKFASKVRVAYPGLYSEYGAGCSSAPYELEALNTLQKKKFFLFVGTVEKRKNLGIVIDAFIRLKQSVPNDYKLVFAGRPGFGFDAYEEKIQASGFQSDIICTGYISSKNIQRLYQDAAAYIFPTVYEGFGSTQLECMANHLPLILSDIPTNREVSDGYGMFFNLNSAGSLVQKMEDVIMGNMNVALMRNIADRVCANFQWKNIVPQYIKAYREGTT